MRRPWSDKASVLFERANYQLNRSRTMIIWDPVKCAINDEIRITDFFGPAQSGQ